MNKVYRNIFFHTKMPKTNGNVDVLYYGSLFTNAKSISGLNDLYDQDKDLYIVCDTCASKKYRNFIKVKN